MATKCQENEVVMKLLIIGDSGVGKSCMMMRYVQNSFTTAFYSTIGVDFKIKKTTIDSKKIKMQIWDTAGQQRFRNVIASYYKGAQGVILMYDVTHAESFRNISYWIQEIQKYSTQNVVKLLVGNKCDKEKFRKVSYQEGQAFARAHGLQFIQVSVLQSIKVEQAFEQIAKKILSQPKLSEQQTNLKQISKLNKQMQNKIILSGCCF